jgi:PKD repeat protein
LYEWDWNNDGIYEESHTNPTATHSWTKAGNYSVILRVTDNSGVTNTKTITIPVANTPNNPTSPKTPGFELIFVMCAIAALIVLWKKKRNI